MPRIISVSLNRPHAFSKTNTARINLLEGLGVEGDAHCGATVKHRSRVAQDPTQPNLRQVHLLHQELFEELLEKGYAVSPGELGENLTTSGIRLLELPRDTQLRIGRSAIIKLTGLRNPCAQIERFRPGLLSAVLDRAADGSLLRKAGVMAVVLRGGLVQPGDPIVVELPDQPQRPLERV